MGPVTLWLILINVGVFAIESVAPDALIAPLALWPIGRYSIAGYPGEVGFHLWQLFTSAFLHANLLHLFLNMFALFMFGRDVERELGSRTYLALYAAAVLTGALVQLAVVSFTVSGEPAPTIGASGGVFGVLLAFGMLFPQRRIMLLFPPIPMPAWLFVTIYGLIELISGVMGTAAGVAHFAHVGGMVGGYLVLRHAVSKRTRSRGVRR